MQHAFVVTFKDSADRDFYVDHDAAHDVFKRSLSNRVSSCVVHDFTSGEFPSLELTHRPRRNDEVKIRTI
jgi:hypothetical protein